MEILEYSLTYILYGATFFIGSIMFVSRRVWKEWTALRIVMYGVLYGGLMIAFAVLSDFLENPAWLQEIIYSVSGVLIWLILFLLFYEKWTKLFYNILAGSLCRFAGSKVATLLLFFLPLDLGLWSSLVSNLLILLFYLPVYFLFARRVADNWKFEPRKKEVLFLLVLNFVILPIAFLEPYFSDDTLRFVYLEIVEIAVSYGFLWFEYVLFENYEEVAFAHTESELTKHRLEQYESFRSVVDVMNQKIHDMKHQIREYADRHILSDAAAEDLMSSVAEYQGYIDTGNPVTDTIFTERNLLFMKRGIRAKWLVDGTLFSFLSAEDAYSLFGNLLGNASEYLGSVEDETLRTVSVYSSAGENFIKFSVENYFADDTIALDRNGFPFTTKEDRKSHGFGTRSVARIAKKYGGNASFRAENHLFRAQVIFPVRREEDAVS